MMNFFKKKRKNTKAQSVKSEPDPYAVNYEDANPWTAEFAEVYFCSNGLDNFPEEHISEDYVFAVSQSRSPGHKDQGQDCLGQAVHGDWEVRVLCDGHDRSGHMVALGVCRKLPHILLRKVFERAKDEVNKPVSDEIFRTAFEECERTVCWTSDDITSGVFVKVFNGEWAGKVGHVAESVGSNRVSVVIVDENGYHRPTIELSYLRGARYTGGSTCVCFLRNRVTNVCKVGVTGDSRLVVLPSGDITDPVMEVIEGDSEDDDTPPPKAVITPSHNVFNESEIERLEKGYKGQFEFDGNFLVNPVTKFAIQPTRGFGDFDMWGTGYTNNPEISNSFKLEPGALVFAASDGVFDAHVWQDDEFITFLHTNKAAGINTRQLVDFVYKETLNRSLDGGYVDDISMFCFMLPLEGEQAPVPTAPVPVPMKREASKRGGSKRQTIKRDDQSAFTALSEKMKDIQTQISQRDLNKVIASADALELIEDDNLDKDEEETTEKVGELLQRFAKKYGQNFDDVQPKELVKGTNMGQEETRKDDESDSTIDDL